MKRQAPKRRRARGGLSQRAAENLRPRLDAFLASAPVRERIRFDPVELPRRYKDPRDIEVAALLSAALAYGRADLFKPKLEQLFAQMGSSPADFVSSFDLENGRKLLSSFVYRFNVGTDIAVLYLGMGQALRELGSLEALFARELAKSENAHQALSGFTRALRDIPMRPVRAALGKERGLAHLLPAVGTGAAKRLHLFLRWMVRGPDDVDFGIWKTIPAAALLIPVDTHIARIARRLSLTSRKDLTWKTAEEITASLRRLDPVDPVKYDFALCHYGMSGACPVKPVPANCRRCLLQSGCRVGQRILKTSP